MGIGKENGDGEKKKKKTLTAYAPVLSAALVAACVGVSIFTYTPTVYEVQAMPDQETVDADVSEEDASEETDGEIVQGSFALDDGIYYGSGTGYAGKISVAVTIASQTITEISVTEVEADDSAFFNRAKGVIDEIISTQTLEVDVVSGATYSSRGIISAVKNALYGEEDDGEIAADSASAGLGSTTVTEAADAAAYQDGTYYGSATGFAGTITVEVVITDGKIASIRIVSHSDGSSYMSKASALLDSIVSTQSTNVDTVSGATYSSVGLINAVRSALAQAAISDEAVSDTEVVALVNTTGSSSGSSGTSAAATKVPVGTDGSFPYPDGTYYGTAEGFGGDITVAVVIKDQTIKSVMIISAEDETSEYFAQAKVLADSVVTAQSADLDVVSGATYSSEGILNAVKAALAEAKAAAAAASTGTSGGSSGSSADTSDTDTTESDADTQTDLSEDTQTDSSDSSGGSSDEADSGTEEGNLYKDGSYTVTVVCEPDEDGDFDSYNLTATVTIQDDRIVSITDVTGDGDSSNNTYIRRAANGTSSVTGMIARILGLTAAETTDEKIAGLDTVSRATCSSKSIKEICREALRQAAEALADQS
ncbi:MAG: FMN-binding protein [Lachnospiraceae bacterium]|nr:FMN-binding protein [Lachnospiraceae bacterium]